MKTGKHPTFNKSPKDSGFTLLELLVSLAVLTLIITLAMGTLRIGHRVWETAETFDARAGLSSFRHYVEQRLSEAMPVHVRDHQGAVRIEFRGETDRLAFVSPASAGPGGGGVYRFELMKGEGSVSAPVVLTQQLYRTVTTGKPVQWGQESTAGTSVTHASKVRINRVEFRYFGTTTPGQKPVWNTVWPRLDSLPDLVEVTITSSDPAIKIQTSVIQLKLKT